MERPVTSLPPMQLGCVRFKIGPVSSGEFSTSGMAGLSGIGGIGISVLGIREERLIYVGVHLLGSGRVLY